MEQVNTQPVNVIVAGAAGRMGRRIAQAVNDDPNMRLVGAFEHPDHPMVGKSISQIISVPEEQVSIEIVGSFEESIPEAAIWMPDVVIDFTAPDATGKLALKVLEYNEHGTTTKALAMVIGTTSLSEETMAMLMGMSNRFPCVQAPNMAVGVNVLFKLAEKAAAILGSDYNTEIVELHHNKKKDAPSGTAVKLGEMVAGALERDFHKVRVFERNGIIGERTVEEIGIQAVRGGDITGEHTVYFCGPGERIELTHRAHNRKNFIEGAIRAALWVPRQANGLYDMFDVLDLTDF